MAERIEIASLSFDTKLILQQASSVSVEISKLRAKQKELKDMGEENSVEFIRNAAEIRRLSGEFRNLNRVIDSQVDASGRLTDRQDALNKALRSENVTIQNAIDNNKELREMRRRLDLTTAEGAAALEEINKKLNENTRFIQENGDANEKRIANIGNYKADIKDALSELNLFNGGIGGFITKVKEAGGVDKYFTQALDNISASLRGLNNPEGGEGAADTVDGITDSITGAGDAAGNQVGSFGKLKTAIGGVVKEAMAFIATPLGAAIAVLVGAFVAGKAIFDFNKGLIDMNKQLTALGVSKDSLSQVRSEVQATAETYDKEFNEVAKTVSTIANQYKISMSEANDVVAQGLANGGALNEAFMGNIGEFSTFFQKAGYSAQEFINIIGNELPEQIKEKIPDAVKEASIALQEQTTATRDALVNAFGAAFSDDLLSRVKTGQTSIKQALDEIAKKAKTANLNQQQQAQLTADLSKSAGEDAGGALVVLDQLGKAATKSLNDGAQASEELRAANERLNKIQANLFEIENFGDMWTKTKALGIDALAALMEYLADMKEYIQPIVDLVSISLTQSWVALKATVGVVFAFLSANFKMIGNTIGTVVKVVTKLLKGDFGGALDSLKEGVMNFVKIITDAFASVKNTIIDFLTAVIETSSPILKALGVDVDKVKGKLESWKSKQVKVKAEVEVKAPDQAKVIADETAKIKQGIEKQIELYQRRRDRLEALGKDTFAADVALFNEQLKLQKKGTPEYAKIYNDLLKLKTDHNSKILSDSAGKLKQEYDTFVALQEGKARDLAEELKLNEQLRDKKMAIANAEYKAAKDKAAAKLKLQADEAKINQEFINKQTELVLKNAEKEYNAIIANNKSKIDASKFVNDEMLRQELERLDRVAAAEKDRLRVKMESEKATQEAINTALSAIDEENRIKKQAIADQQKVADEQRRLVDIENKRAAEGVGFEEDVALQLERLNIQKQQEIDAAEKTGADTKAIEEKYANEKRLLQQSLDDFKISQQEKMLGQVADILGRESKAGKAFAIAQATIQTYQAAVAAYRSQLTMDPTSPLRAALAAAAAVAAGFSNIKKIAEVKTPKAEKGALFSIGGKRHSAGGTLFTGSDGTRFEAEQGELIGVMNRKAASHFMGFNNAFLSGGKSANGNYFATGGVVSRDIQAATGFDYDLLAVRVAGAYASMPAPVVAVTDIITKGNNYIEPIESAQY